MTWRAHQPVWQRRGDAGDGEPGGAVAEDAGGGAYEQEQRRVEPVAEDAGEQAEVVPDVAGDREQGEAALADPERDLERVRVEREGGAGSPRHLHPHRRAQPQTRRPAPRLHRPRPHPPPATTARDRAQPKLGFFLGQEEGKAPWDSRACEVQ